ncbi:MAG: hypothetical protein WDM78_19830 [Puia sp.]
MTKHALSEDEVVNAYSDTILAALDNINKEHFEARASIKPTSTRYFIINVLTFFEKERLIRMYIVRR